MRQPHFDSVVVGTEQLPPPSAKARAFMPEDKPDPMSVEPDDTLQAWSNRLQARSEFNDQVSRGGAQ